MKCEGEISDVLANAMILEEGKDKPQTRLVTDGEDGRWKNVWVSSIEEEKERSVCEKKKIVVAEGGRMFRGVTDSALEERKGESRRGPEKVWAGSG